MKPETPQVKTSRVRGAVDKVAPGTLSCFEGGEDLLLGLCVDARERDQPGEVAHAVVRGRGRGRDRGRGRVRVRVRVRVRAPPRA